MDNGEIILGVSQIVSSVVLGGIAIIYSRRVAIIESDRKELEKKREKVELLNNLNNLQVDIALHGANITSSLSFSHSNNYIEFDILEKIENRYKELINNYNYRNKSKKDIAMIAFNEYFDAALFHDIEKMDNYSEADRSLYQKVLLLIDLLSIRDDIGDNSASIKLLKEKSESLDIIINEPHPLVNVIQSKNYYSLLIREIEKIRLRIAKS